MLIKAQKEITKISDDDALNNKNYIESLGFISNLYKFVNLLDSVVDSDVFFFPTFKGRYTCERMCPRDEECEMRYFKIKSAKFLEDKTIEKVLKVFKDVSEYVKFTDDILEVILKY